MLKPAALYEEELEQKFKKYLYTEDFYYYSGYKGCNQLPNFELQDNVYQYAIIDKATVKIRNLSESMNNSHQYFEERVIGYLSYRIDPMTSNVYNFGLFSFDKGNPTIGLDLWTKMKELVRDHHRVEWRMVEGNPVKRHYDKFCERYGGNIIYLHDVTKDLNNKYVGEYLYEIIT